MNTFTNTVRPEKAVHRTARNNRFHHAAIVTVALALITVIAIAANTADRSVVAESNPAVAYSNALELQYARPWLEAQNKPVVTYGNALEMQYAQPWLDKAEEQIPLNCHSSIEMLYACKYGYGLP